MKEKLYGKTLSGLRDLAAEFALPRHAAGQISAWLYRKGVGDIAAMTDLSVARRAALAERFEIGLSSPLRESVSVDGTKKYLFGSAEEGLVEAAMIPDGERATLCLSSQAGCRMGCVFCATGRQGLTRNLTTGEILGQFASLPERDSLTNIVYMGMGEPLDNPDAVLESLVILTSAWGYGWSPTRITVSTAGITPVLERFLGKAASTSPSACTTRSTRSGRP